MSHLLLLLHPFSHQKTCSLKKSKSLLKMWKKHFQNKRWCQFLASHQCSEEGAKLQIVLKVRRVNSPFLLSHPSPNPAPNKASSLRESSPSEHDAEPEEWQVPPDMPKWEEPIRGACPAFVVIWLCSRKMSLIDRCIKVHSLLVFAKEPDLPI